jgi:hypothetical protein
MNAGKDIQQIWTTFPIFGAKVAPVWLSVKQRAFAPFQSGLWD